MKALCWQSPNHVSVERVDDPAILNPRDAIIEITSTAICGSDLHIYGGYVPSMKAGDILGHEFMGRIAELGRDVKNLKVGDRVIVPFCIACGHCTFCQSGLTSLCDNSNPNAWMVEKMFGHSCAGMFGYSHMFGGYSGGQAQFVRVPYADTGCFKVPDGLDDDHALFLTDILPTGYMAADNCHIKGGDVVAVWGCGPVGQFAIVSAYLLGAERVIAIDRIEERLRMAHEHGHAEIINYEKQNVLEALEEMTGGRGPDACIDAVGMEAHTPAISGLYDRTKQLMKLESDRPIALRESILACRKGGTVSVPGVYAGFIDKFPMGAVFGKGLKLRTGQTHVHRYVKPLLERIKRGEIDPSFVITHRLKLSEAPEAYKTFKQKHDGCIKVVLDPAA